MRCHLYDLYTVHRVIFAPSNVCPSTVLPRLEFTKIQFCLKKNNLIPWNSPSLYFCPMRARAKGEIKWERIFACTQYVPVSVYKITQSPKFNTVSKL